MFENEAEEYAHEHCCDSCKNLQSRYRKVFKDGAEFGYNKAFVEADKNLKAVVADFNKANEWHYPSKGKYPKECENVWCYCKGIGIKFCCVGHIIIGGDNKVRWWANDKAEELSVIAWKEIVLPELKESE